MADDARTLWQMVAEERHALADRLDPVEGAGWDTPSLCSAWTVREVLAHLVLAAEPGAVRRFLPALLRARGSPHRASEQMVVTRVREDGSGAALLAALRSHASSRFAPPGLGPGAPLADVLVHGLDMALPLDLELHRPPRAWASALAFLTTPSAQWGLGRRGRPTLTWVATDLDSTRGSGPHVRGPARALGLAAAGRTALVDELDGPGLPALRAWAGA